VKDFYFDFSLGIEPLSFIQQENLEVCCKLTAGLQINKLLRLKPNESYRRWRAVQPVSMDEAFSNTFEAEQRLGQISVFAMLSILIACV
jgi:hypothetical protein